MVVQGHPQEPNLALSGSYDGWVCVWDLAQGCMVARCACALTANMARRRAQPWTLLALLSGSCDGWACVWGLAQGCMVARCARSHGV